MVKLEIDFEEPIKLDIEYKHSEVERAIERNLKAVSKKFYHQFKNRISEDQNLYEEGVFHFHRFVSDLNGFSILYSREYWKLKGKPLNMVLSNIDNLDCFEEDARIRFRAEKCITSGFSKDKVDHLYVSPYTLPSSEEKAIKYVRQKAIQHLGDLVIPNTKPELGIHEVRSYEGTLQLREPQDATPFLDFLIQEILIKFKP